MPLVSRHILKYFPNLSFFYEDYINSRLFIRWVLSKVILECTPNCSHFLIGDIGHYVINTSHCLNFYTHKEFFILHNNI